MRACTGWLPRVGVPDFRNLVDEKLRTGELYQFMMEEFHQAQAFVLEAMVVAILVIELIDLFCGWAARETNKIRNVFV